MHRTCVFFHAHPDDESLLTAGTMARLSARGHRVVLVVATAGEAGLTGARMSADGLRDLRLAELTASARALGCSRINLLSYADSGLRGEVQHGIGQPEPFAKADVEQAAERLAAVLVEEGAHMVTGYDAHGGYGHPDHVQRSSPAGSAGAVGPALPSERRRPCGIRIRVHSG